jgi:hypothetical protein
VLIDLIDLAFAKLKYMLVMRLDRCYNNPARGAIAQLVARDIRIVEVRSSNLLSSTNLFCTNACYFKARFVVTAMGVRW